MSNDEPQAIDLRQAAAEEAAGELTAAEQAAFSELAKQDPAIASECAFWRCLRSRLTATQPDPLWAPGRSFREGILSRLDWEGGERRRERAVVIPLPAWLGAGLAAGLGMLVGFLLFAKPAAPPDAGLALRPPPGGASGASGETIAYQDDGGALVSPESQQVRWASYMPLTQLHEIETTTPHGPSAEAEETMKPWLGLWTKPVDLETHGVKGGQGHLVLRVAHDGPCHIAGIRPGDVILSIDHRKVMTPHCIADHLVNAKPGDDVLVEYWSAQTASISQVRVTLGCVSE